LGESSGEDSGKDSGKGSGESSEGLVEDGREPVRELQEIFRLSLIYFVFSSLSTS